MTTEENEPDTSADILSRLRRAELAVRKAEAALTARRLELAQERKALREQLDREAKEAGQ